MFKGQTEVKGQNHSKTVALRLHFGGVLWLWSRFTCLLNPTRDGGQTPEVEITLSVVYCRFGWFQSQNRGFLVPVLCWTAVRLGTRLATVALLIIITTSGYVRRL